MRVHGSAHAAIVQTVVTREVISPGGEDELLEDALGKAVLVNRTKPAHLEQIKNNNHRLHCAVGWKVGRVVLIRAA